MKKLISITLPFLFLCSFLLVSCGKELVKDDNVKGEPINDLEIKYEWLKATGAVKTGSGKGTVNIEDGEQVKYILTPKSLCGCTGAKYSYTAPEYMDLAFSADTGMLIVHIRGGVKWHFTITCVCPDGSEHTATITIDAK